MSNFLTQSKKFESWVNEWNPFKHRSKELKDLIVAIEEYVHQGNAEKIRAVKDRFDDWRIHDPKEFANRSKSIRLDEFDEELKATMEACGALDLEALPEEKGGRFSTPPASVRNRHRYAPYWNAGAFPADVWPDLINRHSRRNKALTGAMTATNVGVTATQAGIGQAGVAGLVVGGTVSSATGVGLLVAGAALTLAQCGLAIRSADRTAKHVAALEFLNSNRRAHPFDDCWLRGAPAHQERVHTLVADHILPYIIQQKGLKLARKAVTGFLPIVGGATVTAVTGIKNIASRIGGTLGVERYKAAHWLAAHFCECECVLTDFLVASLYSAEEMIRLHELYSYEDTADLLAAKMKSI